MNKSSSKLFSVFKPILCIGVCLCIVGFSAIAQDLPPVGRSVFDYVLATSDESKSKLVVPYPFENLIKLVKEQTKSKDPLPVSVLFIPFGRSLQRFAAEPNFFKFPRVLIAPVSQPEYSETRIEMDLRDNLYIAYAEPSNMLEIISYNYEAARFEFQIVKNYQKDKKPELFYAPRALCTTCHEGEVPIFPSEPWSETNDNDLLAEEMIKARGSKTYFGYPLKIKDMHGRIFSDEVQKFDFNVLGSGKKYFAHKVVDKICQGTIKEMIACRALGLKVSFAAHFNYWPGKNWDLLQQYKKLMDRYYQNNKILVIPFPFLPDRDPVNNVGVFAESSHGPVAHFPHKKIGDNIKKLADNLRNLPPSHDPKKTRIHELRLDRKSCNLPLNRKPIPYKKYCNTNYFIKIFSMEDTLFIRDLLSKSKKFEFDKFAALIDKMAEEALKSKDAALAQAKLQRRLLLRDLIYYAKKPKSKPYVCCQNKISDLPKLLADGIGTTSIFDKTIKQFMESCGRCHNKPQFDYPTQFLFGQNEKSVRENIKANRVQIIESISSKTSPMPPPNSAEASLFTEEIKKSLLRYLSK